MASRLALSEAADLDTAVRAVDEVEREVEDVAEEPEDTEETLPA